MAKKSGLMCLVVLLLNFPPCFSQDYPVAYRNDEYGLEIKFSQAWEGVKVFEKTTHWDFNIKAATFYVCLPTKSQDWSSEFPGYASIFALTAFTYEDFKRLQASESEMDRPMTFAQNSKYKFDKAGAQACPDDLCHMLANSEYKITVFDPAAAQAYYTPTVNNLRFRESPKTDAKVIRSLRLNEKLIIIEKGKTETINGVAGTWVKIQTQDGEIGWCFDAYLKKL